MRSGRASLFRWDENGRLEAVLADALSGQEQAPREVRLSGERIWVAGGPLRVYRIDRPRKRLLLESLDPTDKTAIRLAPLGDGRLCCMCCWPELPGAEVLALPASGDLDAQSPFSMPETDSQQARRPGETDPWQWKTELGVPLLSDSLTVMPPKAAPAAPHRGRPKLPVPSVRVSWSSSWSSQPKTNCPKGGFGGPCAATICWCSFRRSYPRPGRSIWKTIRVRCSEWNCPVCPRPSRLPGASTCCCPRPTGRCGWWIRAEVQPPQPRLQGVSLRRARGGSVHWRLSIRAGHLPWIRTGGSGNCVLSRQPVRTRPPAAFAAGRPAGNGTSACRLAGAAPDMGTVRRCKSCLDRQ